MFVAVTRTSRCFPTNVSKFRALVLDVEPLIKEHPLASEEELSDTASSHWYHW